MSAHSNIPKRPRKEGSTSHRDQLKNNNPILDLGLSRNIDFSKYIAFINDSFILENLYEVKQNDPQNHLPFYLQTQPAFISIVKRIDIDPKNVNSSV